jgi:hypothetical protein
MAISFEALILKLPRTAGIFTCGISTTLQANSRIYAASRAIDLGLIRPFLHLRY